MYLQKSLAKSSEKLLEVVFIFRKDEACSLLTNEIFYFVKISNLEIFGNFKLIFLAEHVLMTACGM